ncbi:MAG: Hpt domain-containing protein [Cytophagales bacterium]
MEVKFEVLETMLSGDKQTIKKVLGMIMSNSSKIFDSIDNNLKSKNYQGIRQVVHSLKPQMSFLGMTDMVSFVTELEKEAMMVSDSNLFENKVKDFAGMYKSIIFEVSRELDTYQSI